MLLTQIEDTGGSHTRVVYRLGTSNHVKRNRVHTVDGPNSVPAVTSNCRPFSAENSPNWARTYSFTWFLDHKQRRITVGRAPLDEWLACRRDLYLTTHNTHNRHTSISPVGFEPIISAGERPQTYTLDHVATGSGNCRLCYLIIY